MRVGQPIAPALAAQTLNTPYAGAGGGGSAPLTAQFLTLAADAGLSVERVFTPGPGLSAVDSGAGAAYTLSVDATIARSAVTITAGAGLTGGGDLSANRTIDLVAGDGTLTVAANDVRVAQGFAFAWTGLQTWSQLATFNAGARVAAGQNLQFGSDVSLTRKNTDLLALAAGDSFQSTTFTSGLAGWNIAADGTAEFLNVRVRGELSASVFKVSEITATAGTDGVFKSAAALYEDYTAPGSVGSSNTIKAKNSDVGASLFASGDILRIKSFDGTAIRDLWFTITAVGANNTSHTLYTVRLESGTVSTAFKAGTAIVDYGPSGTGFITQSADGTVGSSANMTVATHAGVPWTTQTLRVRLGNLNGAFGTSTDLYGIGMGDYSGGNYLMYNPTDGFVLKAGAGNVLLDANGVTITSNNSIGYSGTKAINFKQGATLVGALWSALSSPDTAIILASDLSAGALNAQLGLDARVASGKTANAFLYTDVNGGAQVAQLQLTASTTSTAFLSAATITLSGAVTATSLNVGAATGAHTGEIAANNLVLGGATLVNVAGTIWSTQAVLASAANTRLLYMTGGAHTGLTSEALDVVFSLNRTVQYATASVPASSRAFVIQAPTYSSVGAATLADAATFVIDRAPQAGTNLTVTRSMALWVQAGWTRLAGGLSVGTVTVEPAAGDITISGGLNVNAVGSAAGQITAAALIYSKVDGTTGGFWAGAGADVSLYRGAASTWYTNAALKVGTGFGCNTKAAQTAFASGGAVVPGAGAFGASSAVNFAALVTLVTNIRTALVNNGIMS